MKSLGEYEIWFLTGSQDLYGEDTLRQVADHAALVAAGLDDAASVPVRIVFKPVVKSPEGIKAACVAASADEDCVGVIAWMHTFSPAKMWIAGLQALRKPLLHLHTQFNRDLPWGEIDMDFMNLNQAAHGDREFAHIETRLGIARKTVSGHWQDPEVAARVGAWARAACGRHDAQGLKVARFGDNMRHVAVTEGDKTEVQIQLGVSVNGFSVGDLAAAVRAVPDAAVDALVDDYEASYTLAPTLRAGGADREALLEAARIEAALRAVMTEGGFGALTDTFENLDGLRQLPGIAVQRLMADGYGFGAEGDWKTAIMVRLARRWRGACPAARRSWRTTPTTSTRRTRSSWARTCSRPARRSPRAGPPARSTRSRSAAGATRCASSSTPRQARPRSTALMDMGDRLRLLVNEVEVVRPPEPMPRLPVGRAVWRPRRTSPPRPRPGSWPAGRTTRCCREPWDRRSSPTSRR